MKKWILFACMALASTTASAVVSVMWRIHANSLMTPNSPGEALNGGSAYLFYIPNSSDLAPVITEIQAAIQNGTFSESTGGTRAKQFVSNATVTNGGIIGGWSGYTSTSLQDYTTAYGYFLALVFDTSYESSNYYSIAAVQSNDPDASPIHVDWTSTNFTSWQAVPEPGGIILVALSAAVIALRRRVRT